MGLITIILMHGAGLISAARDFDIDKKFKRQSFFIAGGKRVSQFFKESAIDGFGNTYRHFIIWTQR